MSGYGHDYKPSLKTSEGGSAVKTSGEEIYSQDVSNVGMSIEIPAEYDKSGIIGKKLNELTRDDVGKLSQINSNEGKTSWDFVGNKPVFGSLTENAGWLKNVSNIPGMNSMAVFHDVWMPNIDPNRAVLIGSIVPAMAATYTAVYPESWFKLERGLQSNG